MRLFFSAALAAVLFATLSACDGDTSKTKIRPAPVVSVVEAQRQNFALAEEAVGTVDPQSAPMIAAEVAGEVLRVYVDVGDAVRRGQKLADVDAQDYRLARDAAQAEVRRVEALAANQSRLTRRYRELTKQNFMSPVALEESEAQLAALQQQLNAARIQLQQANRNLAKASVTSPAAGRIEQRLVSAGDFVSIGKPLFQLAGTQKNVRVILPFPESVAARIRIGQKVLLATPGDTRAGAWARISEIRPMVGNTHSVEAIAEAPGPSPWRAGASVNGRVVLSERVAVAVPETSIVLRPAGEVVYVIEHGKAKQRVVETGAREAGRVEIIAGLREGETIAVDGAAFLTDGTSVTVQHAKPAAR